MPQTSVLNSNRLRQNGIRDGKPIVATDDLTGLIWVDPDRVSGAPCFVGTRVPIKHLWDYLEDGEPLAEFLEGFPGVTREQATGVLEMAFTRLMEGLPNA